jgi:hypothetical protein
MPIHCYNDVYSYIKYTLIHVRIALYFHTSLESDLPSESFRYSWNSFFATLSGKNTATLYRMMLEYTPSLEDALAADHTKVTWLATELEKAGLIAEKSLETIVETSVDADTRAAELISMVTTKVCYSSENFTTFLEVLKKDEATYEHILAKMKGKGMTLYVYD